MERLRQEGSEQPFWLWVLHRPRPTMSLSCTRRLQAGGRANWCRLNHPVGAEDTSGNLCNAHLLDQGELGERSAGSPGTTVDGAAVKLL